MAVTISYTEKAPSPKEYLTAGNVEVERKLLCAWANRLVLCRQLLGYWYGAYYYPPDKYIPSGNERVYDVYAYECSVEPIGTYTSALVTVRYKYMDMYSIGDDTVLISESVEPASEFKTLTKTGLFFGTGGDKVALGEDVEAPAMIIRMFDWVYTLHGVWSLSDAYYDLPGKVNNATVYSRALDRTFPAETLLCSNPSASRELSRYGDNFWTITYRFTYRNLGTLADPKGWNYWLRTDNADVDGLDFERLTDGTDNVPIYTLADFSAVIR